MSKALKRRLDALEIKLKPGQDLPKAIFIGAESAGFGARPYTDDDVISVTADDYGLLERLSDESADDLMVRAEQIPLRAPGSVRLWFVQYKGQPKL